MQLMLHTGTGPFLSQAIQHGLTEQTLSAEALAAFKQKAALMSLKFADKFYNKYKMHLLEQAAHDVIGVISLGLAELTQQDLSAAVTLLQAADSPMKPFQKGWSLLVSVSPHLANRRSLFGDVDEKLLNEISCPADALEWTGLNKFRAAQTEALQRQAVLLLQQQFFSHGEPDLLFDLESMLAEVVIYRLLYGARKVKPDLKQRIAELTIEARYLDATFLQLQTELVLSELPEAIARQIRQDLSTHFAQSLVKTLEFAQKYQQQVRKDTSPERLAAFEHKIGLQQPLLGWPQDPVF